MIDAKLFAGELDGFRYEDMPDDREAWRRVAAGLDAAAREHGAVAFIQASTQIQELVVTAFAEAKLHGEIWDDLAARPCLEGRDARDVERVLLPSLGVERDRFRRACVSAGVCPASVPASARAGSLRNRPWGAIPSICWRRTPGGIGWRLHGEFRSVNRHGLRTLLRGALRPPENDSAFLLDVRRRAVPQERMARYDDAYPVDLVIVGAGAGGGTLSQRLARRGWKVVVLEAGPFWDPDEDWVSDEAGSPGCTDLTRGFARGFSEFRPFGPLPIEHAMHVIGHGHWGPSLRQYMRDYNHWYTLGILSELLPLPDNRVTVVPSVTDRNGVPVARMDYSQCETTARTSRSPSRPSTTSSTRGGAQDVLVHRPLRPPRRRVPDGIRPREPGSVDRLRSPGVGGADLFIADGSARALVVVVVDRVEQVRRRGAVESLVGLLAITAVLARSRSATTAPASCR